MNPDIWMPFYGALFFEAVNGYDEQTIVSYLRAIWHYWHNLHAGPFPDDDGYQRRICQCDVQNWNRVKGVVFGVLFKKCEDGWHQKNAKALHEQCFKLAEKRRNQTANARNTLKNQVTEPVTEPVTDFVTGVSVSSSLSLSESSPSQKDVGRVAKATPASRLTDEAWISSLTANEAYAGIDVKKEFAKMTAWCAVNRKQPSRRRFVNWLNRAERPIAAPSLPVARFGPPMGDVVALAKEKWPQDNRSANWGVSFWKYWEKRGWKRANGDSIDWKVEFSKQVSAWRTTND